MKLPTKYTGDALVIKTRDIKSLIKKENKWLIDINIPRKPRYSANIKTASYDVAKVILDEINSKHLKIIFQ